MMSFSEIKYISAPVGRSIEIAFIAGSKVPGMADSSDHSAARSLKKFGRASKDVVFSIEGKRSFGA